MSKKKPSHPPDFHKLRKQVVEQDELLKQIAEDEESERQAYADFASSVKDLAGPEKAEAWLSYVANNIIYDYSDQEALVYLASRGYDCSRRVKSMIAYWKGSAQAVIEECADGIPYYDANRGTITTVGGMTIQEASQVAALSRQRLRDFWSWRDCGVLSIEATMLRTVEWCDVGGFDEWWHRLAKETNEDSLRGGIQPGPGAFFLFNMCRSDYAIRLMKPALERFLAAIEIPEGNFPVPWRFTQVVGRDWRERDNLDHAAILVFAKARLRPDDFRSELVELALEFLQKHQNADGSWCTFVGGRRPSAETTAIAVHALAIAKPRGCEGVVSSATDWLWEAQDKFGCWDDPGAPDSVYLTVLVLDAIELSNGGTRVTFRLPQPKETVPLTPTEGNVFRKEGDYWTIRHEGKEIRLEDSKGLHYIAYLLARPGKDIHVLELVWSLEKEPADASASWVDRLSKEQLEEDEGLRTSDLGDAGPVLDDQSISAYRQGLADLRDDLYEAEESNDIGRAAKIEEKIRFIEKQLVAALGMGGRVRKAGSPAEKARKAVSNQITHARDRMKAPHPSLWQHLKAYIHTGTYCSYSPSEPCDWFL